jgi:hypothetical protein
VVSSYGATAFNLHTAPTEERARHGRGGGGHGVAALPVECESKGLKLGFHCIGFKALKPGGFQAATGQLDSKLCGPAMTAHFTPVPASRAYAQLCGMATHAAQ